MTLARRLFSLLLAAVVMAAVLVTVDAPAQARGSSYLCSSYDGCKAAGYKHFGYKGANHRMYWQMYAGHNCTNYVAYRLVKGGMPNVRPWSGDGDAKNWGRAKRRITDQRPMVGSVAWWKANVPGAGSSGHVAYVEKVVSARKIVVSEDSWSGDFHWRVITKGGSGWPSGFVHFDDRAVRNTVRPVISGRPVVGQTLTASTGRWTPAAAYRFEWFADGRQLATSGGRLELTPALRGTQIAVRVYARSRGYLEGRAGSDRTAKVAPGTLDVTSRPRITGAPRTGQVLHLERGSWSPSPDSVTVRWYAGTEPIDGATGQQLELTRPLIGKRITVRTTARRDGYKASRTTSEPTTRVQPGRIQVTSPFALGGRPVVGARLEVDPGTFTPSDAKVTYTWFRGDKPVRDAQGRGYTLTRDDLGKKMSVRVVLSQAGYDDRTLTLSAHDRVATVPELRLETEGRPGRAVVKVRVLASGVEHPRGPVTVRVGGREVRGKVVDGRVSVVVPGLERGRHRVRVLYEGAGLVLPARVTGQVRVPAR